MALTGARARMGEDEVMASTSAVGSTSIQALAAMPSDDVLDRLRTQASGLTATEADVRLGSFGPNAVRTHHASALSVLLQQLKSPLLLLLIAAAVVSAFVGQGTDAIIIGIIIAGSVGLGFVNEYRAERAAEALHSSIRHVVTVYREGEPTRVEVTHLVPGDVLHLDVGSIVPADLRLLTASGLECDESILTGESVPAVKPPEPVTAGATLAELSSCLFMGTVVSEGSGDAVVVATGARTQFGEIATGLGEQQPQTEFQLGLSRFSLLLARVGGALSLTIFVVNMILGRPLIEAVLFSLAVAVGITPQLLPAVVSTSLATGSRRLAHKKVLVKRLVCIEDLGDIDVLFTDKTGTLTDGHVSFRRAIGPSGTEDEDVLRLGLVCNEAMISNGKPVGGNPLDIALWEDARSGSLASAAFTRVSLAPFDHDRRLVSVLVDHDGQRELVTKGAPETLIARCVDLDPIAQEVVDREFAAGNRVVAVASRSGAGLERVTPADEHDLHLAGYLVFSDNPKPTAGGSIARLGGPRHRRQDRDRR